MHPPVGATGTVYNNIDNRIAAFRFTFTPWLIKYLNLRDYALRMKRSAKRSGLEVRRVNLVILNQLLIKLVRY